MYSFRRQLTKGQRAEQRLDGFFGKWFCITPSTREQQRMGIDRIWTGRHHGQRLTVEYKADWAASSTGNAWLELATAEVEGWALKCRADYLVYWLPDTGQIFLAQIERLKAALPAWTLAYPVKRALDDGWAGAGLLAPLEEFVRVADQTFYIEPMGGDGNVRGAGVGNNRRAALPRGQATQTPVGGAGRRGSA